MSKVNGSGFIAVFLIACTLITGSLSSCGPVSFAKNGSDTQVTAGDIVVESEEAIPEYYAGEDDSPVVRTGELTSYTTVATSNNEEAGTVEYVTGHSENGQTLTVTATPKEGYVLDHWMINGEEAVALGSESIVTVNDINEDMNLVAVFVADIMNSGSLRDSPILRVTPQTVAGYPQPGSPSGKYRVYTFVDDNTYQDGGTVSGGLMSDLNTPVQISATANKGYKFDHWHIIAGSRRDEGNVWEQFADYDTKSNPYTLYLNNDIHSGCDYQIAWCFAFFEKIAPQISLASMSPDQGAGTVTYNSTVLNVGDAPVSYTPGDTISVAATTPGYYVDSVSFTDSLGVSHTYRPSGSKQTTFNFSISDEFCKDDIYLHAEFTKNKYIVKVIDDPSDGGSSSISYGTATANGQVEVNPGDSVTITSTPDTNNGYVFDCFMTASGTKMSGTQSGSSYTLTLSNISQDETITAKYKKGNINVTIEPSPDTGGTVQFNDEAAVSTSMTYVFDTSNSGFTIKATPKTGYKFQCWEDSVGNAFNTKSVRITGLKEDRTYTAVFVSDDEEEDEKGLRVVAEPASGGHVRKKASATAGKVDLTASANRGWKFIGWKKEGGTIFSKNTKVTVNDESVTYVGCFEKDKNHRETTDIVDIKFYDEKRKVTHPNYTVTRQTMENLATVNVSYDKLRNANDLPGLHGYGAVASVKKYLEGKLAASEVILVEGILTTTRGEIIGTENIKDIDALMNSARDITLKKFGDRYDSEIVAAVYTNPPENFDGLVRTYLWKETDTEYLDNIYVMYRDKGSSYEEMAAIVDEDGTVRFTLEDALIGTEFALVRVNIEDKK